MNRTKVDKLRSNVVTLLNELDNEYLHRSDSIGVIPLLATRIYELAGGMSTRLAAADVLAEKSRRLEEAIINCDAERHLSVIAEWQEWQDALRQYGEGDPLK